MTAVGHYFLTTDYILYESDFAMVVVVVVAAKVLLMMMKMMMMMMMMRWPDEDQRFTAVLSSSPNEAYLRLSPPHDKLF